MPLRLGFDIDGVLADFRSAFERAADHAGVTRSTTLDMPADHLSSRDIKRVWDHVRKTPNWWMQLAPYEPEQIGRLYDLARRLKWEVVFMTRRPATSGDPVQFQTQWWLEEHGFFYPAVVTVPGSRGELANALRLDAVVDDQMHNCVDVIGASTARAVLLLRDGIDAASREHATNRGIGVVSSLQEAIDVVQHLQDVLRERRGRLQRLADWFTSGTGARAELPDPPDRNRRPPAGEGKARDGGQT